MLNHTIKLDAATANKPNGFLAIASVNDLTPLVKPLITARSPAPPNTAPRTLAPSIMSAMLMFNFLKKSTVANTAKPNLSPITFATLLIEAALSPNALSSA